jgi:hypothetical protein
MDAQAGAVFHLIECVKFASVDRHRNVLDHLQALLGSCEVRVCNCCIAVGRKIQKCANDTKADMLAVLGYFPVKHDTQGIVATNAPTPNVRISQLTGLGLGESKSSR